ncbi:radical SAM/SPASM family putative metalloenzyme maturase [Chloroflexota bacterium]
MVADLTRLNIEITARCNLNCQMCVRHAWQEGLGDMSLETYRRLLPAFSQLSSVNLSGIGEPLLHKDIFKMVRLAKSHLSQKGRVSFTTNAIMINEAMAEKLVSSGLDDVVVSVDGATSETFSHIRCGASLDIVLDSIRLLDVTKKRLGSQTPSIGIEFVAMQRNVHELPALVELAANLGVSFIIVSNVLPHTEEINQQVLYEFNSDKALVIFNEAKAEAKSRGLTLKHYPEFTHYIQSLFGMPPLRGVFPPSHSRGEKASGEKEQVLNILEKAASKAIEQNVVLNFTKLVPENGINLAPTLGIFSRARAEAQKYGVELDLPPLIPNTQRECGFIRDGICFISWDGYVRPCGNLNHSYTCYINNRLKYITGVSFGNVLKHDLMEIWGSEDYHHFREQVGRFDFAPCGDCNFADACYFITLPTFTQDCYSYALPCGDCPWARGILKCF